MQINSSSAYYIYKDELIVDCNTHLLDLFQMSKKEEIIGVNIKDLFPLIQHDHTISLEKYVKYVGIINSNLYIDLDWTYKRLDGTTFLSHINILKLNDLYYVFICDTINRLQNTIKEKDHIYKILFNDNRHIMLLIDPIDGKIIDVNKAAVQFYGYSYDSLLNMTIYQINGLTDVEIYNKMQNALTDKKNNFHFKHKLVNGELRDVEVNSVPITIDHKQLLFSIVIDITDKIKQNLYYYNMFMNSPNAIIILDKDQKVVDVNNQFTAMFQYQHHEVVGQNIIDFTSSTEYRQECEKHQRSLFEGNIIIAESVRKRKDHQLLNVKVSAFPISYNNTIIGAYLNYVDITERVKFKNQVDHLKEQFKL